MTVAADIVFKDLKEPVRFVKEAKVRVFPPNEKFWNPSKPRIQEEFVLELKEVRWRFCLFSYIRCTSLSIKVLCSKIIPKQTKVFLCKRFLFRRSKKVKIQPW